MLFWTKSISLRQLGNFTRSVHARVRPPLPLWICDPFLNRALVCFSFKSAYGGSNFHQYEFQLEPHFPALTFAKIEGVHRIIA